MELSPYLQALVDDVEKVTALADESTRMVTSRLLVALEPSLRLALVQAISDTAALVTSDLDGVVAVVRMEGRDPVITVEHVNEAPAQAAPAEDEGDDSARITVRIPQGLKQRAEARAAQADQSLNTWIVQAIRRSAREDDFLPPFVRPRVPGARRVTGWA